MKNLFLAALGLMVLPLTAYATTVDVDTIYYDADWKVVASPHFASYYRVAERDIDHYEPKKYRDYYITGELEGEGMFRYLDPADDSKSGLDGNWTKYFRSGKLKAAGTRVYGLGEGDFVEYYEDGSIKEKGTLLHGHKHGLHTEFTEDGLCRQAEYAFDNPTTKYYVMTDDKGNYSKVKFSDGNPYWVSPDPKSVRSEFRDGVKWYYYIHDGLVVSACMEEVNENGKYYRVHLIVTDNSFFPVEFNLDQVSASLVNNKGFSRPLDIQSAKDYDIASGTKHKWQETITDFVSGLSTADAGRHNASGLIADVNRASLQAQLAACRSLAAFTSRNIHVDNIRNVGYLRRNTIHPGESLSGFFNVPKKKGRRLDIKVVLSGATYSFSFPL